MMTPLRMVGVLLLALIIPACVVSPLPANYGETGGGWTPPSEPPPPPPRPEGVVASAGDGEVSIHWNAVQNATGYLVVHGIVSNSYTSSLTAGSSPFRYAGLPNGMVHYFAVAALNGSVQGPLSIEVSAVPSATAPRPETGAATDVTDTTATLHGTIDNPVGSTTSVWFEYGTSTSYGSVTTVQVLSQAGQVALRADLTALPQRTVLHARLVAQNGQGTFVGGDVGFRTTATPIVLASGLDAPAGLKRSGGFLYWMEIYGDVVRRVPGAGGAFETLATSQNGGNDGWLSLDATHVYWSDWSRIWRADLGGSPATEVVSGLQAISRIAVHSTGLYWRTSTALQRQDPSTLSIETIASSTTWFGGGLVVGPDAVYFVDYWGGTIHARPHAGGPVQTLISGVANPLELVLDFQTLYWTDNSGIRRVDLTNGAITTVVAASAPRGLAKDADHVYWTDWDGLVRKAPVAGGPTVTLVVGQTGAVEIEVDDDNVYWMVGGSHYYPPMGSLRKVPKGP